MSKSKTLKFKNIDEIKNEIEDIFISNNVLLSDCLTVLAHIISYCIVHNSIPGKTNEAFEQVCDEIKKHVSLQADKEAVNFH